MKAWKRVLAVVALVGLLIAIAVVVIPRPPTGLQTFRTYEDLARYLDEAQARGQALLLEGGARDAFGGPLPPAAGTTVPGEGSYSGTNVQVQGVDELDTVKTDGTYLYLASASNVTIVRAYPADAMEIVSRIDVSDASGEDWTSRTITGVFVAGQRLVVVSSNWSGFGYGFVEPVGRSWDPGAAQSQIQVFDLTAIDDPVPVFSVAVSGTPVTARMADGVVYLTAVQYVWKVEDLYLLPQVCSEANCASIDVQRVYYDPEAEDASTFTNILAVEIETEESRAISLVTGYTSTVYMSPHALYASYVKWDVQSTFPFPTETSERTSIYKIRVKGTGLEPVAQGQVPGRLLNQFSMDEHGGHLRVATTSGWRTMEGGSTTNAVYVLNETLAMIGRLEGLAPGETIYSARFMGDRAYLVTFEKIDPFFVLDLSDPAAPRLLGSLKIPGYSDYLHPFDEDRVLGLGKDAMPAEGNFSWFQGLKLSLFDVSEAESPQEVSKVVLGDRGTDSEALYDHKAFLLSPSQGLLVFPVALYEFDGAYDPPPFEFGEFVHQGAYVFSVTLDRGFEFRGAILHTDASESDAGYPDWSRWVRRSLWIGEVLYTISPAMVKANLLSDLSEVGSVVYGTGEGPGGPWTFVR